jgi:hypothetical protein
LSVRETAKILDTLRYRYGWSPNCDLRVFSFCRGPGEMERLGRFLDHAERLATRFPFQRFLIVTEGAPTHVITLLLGRPRLSGRIGVLAYCGPQDPRRAALATVAA